ncbi:MAG: DUF4190 domain-containing protein, partial [Lentisphaeria bacterium]|nr:DUF4190 domain-containing protein [Lentisphaeria bacterium]
TYIWNEDMSDWQSLATYNEENNIDDPKDTAAGVEDPELKEGEDYKISIATSQCTQCGEMVPENDLITYNDLIVCISCKPEFMQKVREGIRVKSRIKKKRQTLEQGNSYALAGLILAILSIFISFCCCCPIPSWIFGIVFSLLGLIFSILGLNFSNKNEGNGKAMAITGLVVSSIVLIIFVLIVALIIFS